MNLKGRGAHAEEKREAQVWRGDIYLSSQYSGQEQEEQELTATWAIEDSVSVKKQQTNKTLKYFMFLFVSSLQ